MDETDVIREVNASNVEIQNQYLRARQAADVAARSKLVAAQASSEAWDAEVSHQVVQDERPQRRAPLPRQVACAAATVALDGVACYFAAQVLNGSQDSTPPNTRVPNPPPPLGADPTAFQKARHNQAVQQYQQTVDRALAALTRQQQETLLAWAESTVARAFASPVPQSAGDVKLNEDLDAAAADLSSMRQAGAGVGAGTVIAIAGITGTTVQPVPTLPIGLQGSTVVVDDFPGGVSEEAAWQASLLQTGAARVVLLTPATDEQMASVIDQGLDDAFTDTLTSVLFALGQHQLQTAALQQLRQLLYLLTVRYTRATATINGYTDSLPAPGGNLQLSLLRAQAVETWIIAHGMASDRIQAFGYGDSDPVAPNTPDGQPLNRRVVVVIDPAIPA